ncbi:hypothetical protein LAZ67_9002716 [Cordylochernes scorpioides]|uniref:Transposase n=1 Tax=Cordylochernes scorpioides TaxID=51811 RepID=A0ABY6KYZ9_9ARAC|nr:hypothetical protein LAZ67_9002716 [Cordylochernes scorpioides]
MRQEFAAWVFRQIDIEENWLSNVLWTDDAHFSLKGEFNIQNSRIWATENPRNFTEMPLYQPRVTVLCGFTSFIIGPFFFEKSMEELLKPFLAKALSEITFMKDGGPPHISRGAKQLLKDTFGENRVISRHFIYQWPPRSPDLTPCDFCLWGAKALSEITFMKDGGPPHISRGAKQLLKDTFGENRVISRHFIYQWPPRSPDLTPCDFCLWGRISTEDEHGPGRPVESVTQENIDKIHDLGMLDRRMTVRQIEETLGIPKTTVDRIMREHLGLRKISARWVPKLLTPEKKALRRKLSSDNLALFEANPEEFVNRFVTMDETWAHHFTPESKQQSMQWRHSGSPPPKKAKAVPSVGKVMLSVFWDSEGVILLDFLNKGQTITGDYYSNLVKQLREAIKEKRRGKLSRKIVYHQDNAPSHRSLQAMATIYDSGFELLPHAPYSPDLAPSDFNLFPHLKKSLSGIHFRSDEEVIDAVTSFFESLETSFFLEGIKALEHRWKKCIDLKGDYVEG